MAEGLPELPDQKQARFVAGYGPVRLRRDGADARPRNVADYFEACVAHGGSKRDGKAVANYSSMTLTWAAFANSRLDRVKRRTCSRLRLLAHRRSHQPAARSPSKVAKDLLRDSSLRTEPVGDPAEPSSSVAASSRSLILGAIEKIVDEIIAANPDQGGQGSAPSRP
jgi:aspartyl-tRNA(Asn)/glutamyl-tRNA(Gln) amidotransferase subunit B